MIDDSPKSNPAQLSEKDAAFLTSLLMEDAPAPLVDPFAEDDSVIDLTDNPTLTFHPEEGLATLLSEHRGDHVSDLVDVIAVLRRQPSPEEISRSIFGQPEPGTSPLIIRRGPPVGSQAMSQGWFRPVSEDLEVPVAAAATAVGVPSLLAQKTQVEPKPNIVVRLDTASGSAEDEVVFSAVGIGAERRRLYILGALFVAALAIGSGLVALLGDNSLFNRDPNAEPVEAEVVTTQAPNTTAGSTTVAPTTAAPATAAPTTAAPTTAAPTTAAPTTAAPTTAAPTTAAPTTAAPTTAAPATTTTTVAPTTAAPTTNAPPRTTRPPATTQPPTTAPPTTSAPTITFAPPTWAEPLE